jgi:hypothetical protein
MTDSDIENVYKSNLGVSHYAGLRAVYDAGYADALGSLTPPSTDVSQAASAPQTDATIVTP